MELLYLSRADVETIGMSMAEVVQVVEQALIEKGHGRIEMPPKPGIHPRPDAFIHAMPAYIPSMSIAGIKWISGYPENYKRGLPYINSLIVLNNPDTGIASALIDGTWITAMRTGAATAIAAKHLARRDARVLAIIGCGVQGRANLEGLKLVLPSIECVRAYDIHPQNTDLYASEVGRRFKIEIAKCHCIEEAIREADIVVTAGPIIKHREPAIEAKWLKTGIFACSLDFGSCFTPDTLAAMDKLYTDDVEQQRYFASEGYFEGVPEPHGEIGEVLTGRKRGRVSGAERIMFANLGLAIEDMATAKTLYQRAREAGLGRRLPL